MLIENITRSLGFTKTQVHLLFSLQQYPQQLAHEFSHWGGYWARTHDMGNYSILDMGNYSILDMYNEY